MKTALHSTIVLVLLVALLAATVEARIVSKYPGRAGAVAQSNYAACIRACNGVYSATTAGCVGLGSQFRAANAPSTYRKSAFCKSDAGRKMIQCKHDCKTKK